MAVRPPRTSESPTTFSLLALNLELDPSSRGSASNRERLREAAAAAGAPADPPERSAVVLPERWWRDGDRGAYHEAVAGLAREWGRWVVGGSLHTREGDMRNLGVAAAPTGEIVATYSKRHPFAGERLVGIGPGSGPSFVRLGELPVLVVVCADLFDPALFPIPRDAPPAALLVCAASTSRKRGPEFARALWANVAVARAWECNAALVVSDWAPAVHLPGYRTCGVGGLADPCRVEPPLFEPADPPGRWFRIDRAALDRLAQDRIERNFLWREPGR